LGIRIVIFFINLHYKNTDSDLDVYRITLVLTTEKQLRLQAQGGPSTQYNGGCKLHLNQAKGEPKGVNIKYPFSVNPQSSDSSVIFELKKSQISKHVWTKQYHLAVKHSTQISSNMNGT